jgi:N-acetylglucosamine-6-sulfatase
MRRRRFGVGELAVVALVLGILGVSDRASGQSACQQIRKACQDAGFAVGSASGGNGLMVDCVMPTMQGRAQRPKASKPLPQVDLQTVADCKAENPDFGKKAAAGAGGRAAASGGQGNLAGAGTAPPAASAAAPLSSSEKHPNIVFILTDDLALNLVQYMPHVLQMQKDGAAFTNYFVTDSLCCPSRSSIFTGRYPHSTGVFKNNGPDGGYNAYVNLGNEGAAFSNALSAAGYRTAMMGKYLNGYIPERNPPGPGWTSWDVAGNGYPEFNYSLNEDGKIDRRGNSSQDYLVDVLSGLGVDFIKQSKGQAFVIEIATFAPHAPYTPAPRDENAFPGLKAPRNPSYDAAPDADSAKWLRNQPPLRDAEMTRIDEAFRKRAQSVLAVDKMIGELQAAVAAIGQEKNTYFVFSSDNGYHMGEHRLRPGKMTAFDTDIHVPLVVTGPGVPAGLSLDEVVENVDLNPTFTELSGIAPMPAVEGHSLVPLLQRKNNNHNSNDVWRTVALVEHHGPPYALSDPDLPAKRSGNPPSYEAIRSPTAVYVEYADGDREYHDLVTDPWELHNTFASLQQAQEDALHSALTAIQSCQDAASCWAAQHLKLGAK